jgi:hypothetical protein
VFQNKCHAAQAAPRERSTAGRLTERRAPGLFRAM